MAWVQGVRKLVAPLASRVLQAMTKNLAIHGKYKKLYIEYHHPIDFLLCVDLLQTLFYVWLCIIH